jgi:hypothetical protein
MKGHIYRRIRPDGNRSRWYAVIDLPPSPTGARRQQTTTHDTRREAQAWLAQRVQELRAIETYDTKLTTGDFLTSWLTGNQALRPPPGRVHPAHQDPPDPRPRPAAASRPPRASHRGHVHRHHRQEPGPGEGDRSDHHAWIYATLYSAMNSAVRRA